MNFFSHLEISLKISLWSVLMLLSLWHEHEKYTRIDQCSQNSSVVLYIVLDSLQGMSAPEQMSVGSFYGVFKLQSAKIQWQ